MLCADGTKSLNSTNTLLHCNVFTFITDGKVVPVSNVLRGVVCPDLLPGEHSQSTYLPDSLR